MLLWFLLLMLAVGVITYKVSYFITKPNIKDTVKAALENEATEKAKEALQKELAKGFKVMVEEKEDDAIQLEVLIENSRKKLKVKVESEVGIASDIHKGMLLKY